jgi:hypothetical protein
MESERKFLRKIYRTVLVNGQRRYNYSNEISQSCKEMELTKNIILGRLQLVGHVLRMKQDWEPNTVLKRYIEGKRPVEGSERDGWRQRTGMLEDVEMWEMECRQRK